MSQSSPLSHSQNTGHFSRREDRIRRGLLRGRCGSRCRREGPTPPMTTAATSAARCCTGPSESSTPWPAVQGTRARPRPARVHIRYAYGGPCLALLRLLLDGMRSIEPAVCQMLIDCMRQGGLVQAKSPIQILGHCQVLLVTILSAVCLPRECNPPMTELLGTNYGRLAKIASLSRASTMCQQSTTICSYPTTIHSNS